MGFLGDVVGGLLGYAGAEQQGDDMIRNTEIANQFSAEQVALNREFQERMSSTSYQRGTADMKTAGLNPMLAYSQGGASSPSGNAAQGIAAGTVNKLGNAMQGAQSAAQIQQVHAQTENTKAQTENVRADTDNKRGEQIGERGEFGNILHLPRTWEAKLKQAMSEKQWNESKLALDHVDLTRAQVDQVKQMIKNAITENKIRELDIPKAINEARAQESWYMKNVAPYTGELGKAAGSASRIRGMFRQR